MRQLLLSVAVLFCGCGGSAPKANPCATRGATYLAYFQQVAGDCGDINPQVININPDGTLAGASSSCASETTSGCTTRGTNCTWNSGGFAYSQTFETTFAQDGSAASGVTTVTARDGSGNTCASSYNMSAQRN